MSDFLPFEIQVEIITKLPVKSLIQFRSVSKAWKSLIDSSHFIARYSGQHSQMQRLLVMYEDPVDCKPKWISIADDDTFPHQQVSLSLTIPLLVYMLICCRIIGSYHGLFCLFGVYTKGRGGPMNMAVLWNPSIRKAVPVVVPNVANGIYRTVIGFGVCPVMNDPKIVKITYIIRNSDMESITSLGSIPWQVEVFTLSTGAWRSQYSSNLPRKSIQFRWLQVAVDGFLYWLVEDRITTYSGFESYNLVISFDMTSEEFSEVNLPNSLAHQSCSNLSVSKLRDSLVVLESSVEANNPVFSVWMMEGGFQKSFTKVFGVNVNTPFDAITVFRKSGEPIIEIFEDDLESYKLVVYDPYSKHINDLGIDGRGCSFSVYPYMDTLLLHDQPNLTVYNEMETIKFLDDLVSKGT